MATREIMLGGGVYPVSAFTFDQLERLEGAFLLLAKPGSAVGAARQILEAALGDQLPDTVATNAVEMFRAVDAIAEVSGLAELGERAIRTRSGTPSAPGSPPKPVGAGTKSGD